MNGNRIPDWIVANILDVWIRDRTIGTPAHRIARGWPVDGRRDVTLHCDWQPLGGMAVSRVFAKRLSVKPCTRCFPLPADPEVTPQ